MAPVRQAARLNQVAVDGQVLRTIALPCRAPTMPDFGGAQAETLYVTSLVQEQWDAAGTCDGALIAFPAPTKGA